MRNALVLVLLVLPPLGCRNLSRPTAKPSAPPSPEAVAASSIPCPQPTPLDQSLDIFSDDGTYVGSSGKDGHYMITAMDLGLDQWENGKPASTKTQWSITCNAKPKGTRSASPWCQIVELNVMPFGGRVLLTHNDFSTTDGNIQITRADWANGAIDFRIHRPEGLTTEVELRFAQRGGVLRLQSLRAIEVFRSILSGDLTNREYRLAKYSTVLNVPLQFNGRSSAARERWDSVIAALPPADRAIWQEIVADAANRPASPEKKVVEFMKSSISDWQAVEDGKRDLTPEENARIQKLAGQEFSRAQAEWLSRTRLSESARRSILQFTGEHLEQALRQP